MPLLPVSKAVCKLMGHTWGSWSQLLESLAPHGNPKSRSSQTESCKTDSSGP